MEAVLEAVLEAAFFFCERAPKGKGALSLMMKT